MDPEEHVGYLTRPAWLSRWKVYVEWPCTNCGAQAGEPCGSARQNKWGQRWHSPSAPHWARLHAVAQELERLRAGAQT